MSAILGIIMAIHVACPTPPKFRCGEIFALSYTDRYGVVVDRTWCPEGWEYTVMPAEAIFPKGAPVK